MVIKQGSGARKMAVFVDPNCGYCKRFERDLAAIKDVTIYTFLMPILGPDSNVKSRDIWCAKEPRQLARLDDRRRRAAQGHGQLRHRRDRPQPGVLAQARINGTPAVFFEDGTRKPGAIPGAEVERLLVAASTAK